MQVIFITKLTFTYLLIVHIIAPPHAPSETTPLYNTSIVPSDSVVLQREEDEGERRIR